MRKKTDRKQYFRVYLDKIVPMQAGLGGGSSNAATAMHGFNVLNNQRPFRTPMQEYACHLIRWLLRKTAHHQ
jgi:4-diphosphocytidyl-2C-methyl-D-erythritol kinase